MTLLRGIPPDDDEDEDVMTPAQVRASRPVAGLTPEHLTDAARHVADMNAPEISGLLRSAADEMERLRGLVRTAALRIDELMAAWRMREAFLESALRALRSGEWVEWLIDQEFVGTFPPRNWIVNDAIDVALDKKFPAMPAPGDALAPPAPPAPTSSGEATGLMPGWEIVVVWPPDDQGEHSMGIREVIRFGSVTDAITKINAVADERTIMPEQARLVNTRAHSYRSSGVGPVSDDMVHLNINVVCHVPDNTACLLPPVQLPGERLLTPPTGPQDATQAAL